MLSAMAGMMLSCDEATFLISKERDTRLTFREKLNLRMHLLSCKICMRFEKEIRAIDRYLKSREIHTCDHHLLNKEQKQRIQKNILKEME